MPEIVIEAHGDEREDITSRTQMAHEAVHEAHKAQMGVITLKRRVRRISWVWASLGVIFAIFATGFAGNEALHHLATSAQVNANTDQIQQLQRWKEMKDEHERSRDETVTRMARQIDGLYEHLMRGK